MRARTLLRNVPLIKSRLNCSGVTLRFYVTQYGVIQVLVKQWGCGRLRNLRCEDGRANVITVTRGLIWITFPVDALRNNKWLITVTKVQSFVVGEGPTKRATQPKWVPAFIRY